MYKNTLDVFAASIEDKYEEVEETFDFNLYVFEPYEFRIFSFLPNDFRVKVMSSSPNIHAH